MQLEVTDFLNLYEFKSLRPKTLMVESEALKKNPLRDSNRRRNPVLVPATEAPKQGWPVVFMLSGYAGNGTKYFSDKGFEDNAVQTLDIAIQNGEAPQAVYVFVDAWTSWGGSQFINSGGMGNYEDYIVQELVPAVKDSFSVDSSHSRWCIFGGSSGGYGALHLSSQYPELFSWVVAIAPDCFFEASLLPEVYQAIPIIEKIGGVKAVMDKMQEGNFLKTKDAFTVLNAIAMTLCYSPAMNKEGLEFPIDPITGLRIEEVWQRWQIRDPINFLPLRQSALEKLKGIYLDVGTRDQFHLQYGVRQIKETLKKVNVPLSYSEFDGTHSDIGERRVDAWQWLFKKWSDH